VLARSRRTEAGHLRWKIRLDTGLCPDITVAVRLDAENTGILDYYLLPWLDLGPQRLNLSESNGIWLETYRFDGLEALYRLAARSRIRRAA
jgi:hypothetical protein